MPRSRRRPPPPWGSIQVRTTSRGVERFRVRYDVLGPDGQREQRSETVGSWDAGLDLLRKRHLESLEGNSGTLRPNVTLETYLAEWLSLLPGGRAGEATQGLYAQAVRLWLVPTLGQHRLDRLSAPDVRRGLQMLQARGLAASTIRQARNVLVNALNDAVAWRMIPANPAKGVRVATAARTPPRVWTQAQARAFLTATADDRDGPLWRVMLDTGMRVGEALALARDDVDLAAGVVTIRRTLTRDRDRRLVLGEQTKTEGGRRRVSLSPSTVAALRGHLARLSHEREVAFGWDDQGLLFPGFDGRHQDIGTLRSRYTQAIMRAGLPVITLHALRHTNATLLLRAGVPVTVVSKRLGHKHVSMTLDVYAHVLEDMEDAAAEVAETLFGGAAETQ